MAKRKGVARNTSGTEESLKSLQEEVRQFNEQLQVEYHLPAIEAAATAILSKYESKWGWSLDPNDYVMRSCAEWPHQLPAEFPPGTKSEDIRAARDAREVMILVRLLKTALDDGNASIAARRALALGVRITFMDLRDREKYIRNGLANTRALVGTQQAAYGERKELVADALQAFLRSRKTPPQTKTIVRHLVKATGLKERTIYRILADLKRERKSTDTR